MTQNRTIQEQITYEILVRAEPESVLSRMLIDEYMPVWDIRSRHRITVLAAPAHTYAAIRTADLARHPIVRGLLALRALPGAVVSGQLAELRERAGRSITLADFERHGFAIVAESPPHEILLGLEGAFWRPGGDLRPVDRQNFSSPVPAGVARAGWSFAVVAVSTNASTLLTETRVLSGDSAARRRFRIYWACVGWGSGLIRRLMLRTIRSTAERPGHGAPAPDAHSGAAL